jgi:cytochrome bd-type quinol oxidase subunit 2
LPKEILMGLMFIVGLVLTIFAFKIASSVTDCNTHSQNALRGLLVMGVMLMSISGTTLGINCDIGKSDKSVNGMIFVILMLIIGIITTALVSVIHKNCEDARKDTPVLLTLSVLIMVVSLGYLGYSIYNKHLSSDEKQMNHIDSKDLSSGPPRVFTPRPPSGPPPPPPPPGTKNAKSSFGGGDSSWSWY